MEELAVWFAFAFLPAGIFALAVFIWQLAWAPWRLLTERLDSTASRAQIIDVVEARAQEAEARLEEFQASFDLKLAEPLTVTLTRLGELLTEGQALQESCLNTGEAPAYEKAQNWRMRTATYLRRRLDISYAARFESAAGLLFSMNFQLRLNQLDSSDHRKLWTELYYPLARLTEMIAEIQQDLSTGGHRSRQA